MDRLTRKDLKTDKFAVEVTHTVEYLGEHRKSLYIYGGIGLAVLILAAGFYYWTSSQHAKRQKLLGDALQNQNAPATSSGNPFMKSFATQAEKDQAVQKGFDDVIAKYPDSAEAAISHYMLGMTAIDKGKLTDAENHLKQAAASGKTNYASLAKLSLSELYAAQGKTADSEKLLRELLASPTTLVSKEQASISLARLIAPKNLAEAQKLLDPLRTISGATGQAAMNAYTEISQKK